MVGGKANGQPFLPAVELPAADETVRPIDVRVEASPFTGSLSLSLPIHTSPCRGPFPRLTLVHGGGNGPFGRGWSLSLPSISRRTDRGIPRYDDDLDTFLLGGDELV